MKGFEVTINPTQRISIDPIALEESKTEEAVKEVPELPVME